MARQDWTPDPEQMALMPEISGNAINGLGEAERRRPRPVYWALDPADIPHGQAQLWFYRQNDHPDLNALRAARKAEEAIPLPPVTAPSGTPDDRTAADWTDRIAAQARALGAEAVGIARVDPDWAYDGGDLPWRFIIVMAIAMDYDTMAQAPELAAGVEVVRQYGRGMTTAKALAGWLRRQGHDAVCEHGPFTGALTLIPAAIAAGLGELGKHGSLINRDLGSMFRLTAVLTNLDLVPDAPDSFGADGFCGACRICENACPPGAILREKQTVRGETRWYVDFDRCLPYFNETAGCAICLSACPFSRPGIGSNLVAKLARRAPR
ncbi:MAG: epoxyqueuosine reductase [Rhodobacter sp.]|nr:epoxyqueuosine reductase [Paracoccaceae bacterium]MCC0076410.1 epoxyqueuosine reductase [Rhodobacter sp.]